MAFLDDCWMLRLCGPRMVEEFDVASGATGQLSDFTRECAILWRELYGRRRGHFNPKATEAAKLKRRSVSGCFRSIANGALSLAVGSRRAASGAGGQPLHGGAGTSESAYCGVRLWESSDSAAETTFLASLHS